MIAILTQVNCAFRGQTEPTSLQWPLVQFGNEEDPNSIFHSMETVTYSKIKRKGGKMTIAKPSRNKTEYKMTIHDNQDDPLNYVKMMKIYRSMCSESQLFLFCKPVPADKVIGNTYFYPDKPVTKSEFCNMVRDVAQFSCFDNAERCTAYAPRKCVHDLMVFHKVPLGTCSILYFKIFVS